MKIPLHIGFIMDGNRRYAKKIGKPASYGHLKGAQKLREVLKWLREYNIKYATFYSLSTENIRKRSKEELGFIFHLFEKEFSKVLKKSHDVHKYGVRVRIIGRKSMLPEKLRKLFERVEKETKRYSNYFLNFAIAYGGQQEIVDAVKKIVRKAKKGNITSKDINEDSFGEYLYTNGQPPVDIVVRTGGEKRISNFLLWQSAYAELFFVNKFWPEFDKKDFEKILKEYSRRERRFGK